MACCDDSRKRRLQSTSRKRAPAPQLLAIDGENFPFKNSHLIRPDKRRFKFGPAHAKKDGPALNHRLQACRSFFMLVDAGQILVFDSAQNASTVRSQMPASVGTCSLRQAASWAMNLATTTRNNSKQIEGEST